jgi:hypothetical protein
MEYQERNNHLQRMLNILRQLAEEDGVISPQEAEVLKQANITVDLYDLALTKALEDGIITSEEMEKLKFIENTMLTTTFDLIEQDSELDNDAQELVKIFFDTLMNIMD